MSRTLLTLSLAVLAVAGLAPVAVMILRVVQDPAALQGLLDERTLSLLGRTLLLGGGVLCALFPRVRARARDLALVSRNTVLVYCTLTQF